MPAPPRNRNAVRHGLRSASLPKGAAYIARATNELRAAVEDALMAARGEIGILDAATIQTIMRHERHAMLAQRWLRKHFEDMNHDQRLRYSAEIARASAARDAALRSLGIEQRPADVWAAVYATPVMPPEPSPRADEPNEADGAADASGEAVGNDAGNEDQEGQG